MFAERLSSVPSNQQRQNPQRVHRTKSSRVAERRETVAGNREDNEMRKKKSEG